MKELNSTYDDYTKKVNPNICLEVTKIQEICWPINQFHQSASHQSIGQHDKTNRLNLSIGPRKELHDPKKGGIFKNKLSKVHNNTTNDKHM